MANVKFHYTEPGKPEPIYFEQIYAEKPGGGLVKAPAYDIKPTTALGEDADGNLQPIKCAVLTEDAAADAATIKVAKRLRLRKGRLYRHGQGGRSNHEAWTTPPARTTTPSPPNSE